MTQPDLERVRGNIAFLRSAADYFRKRPINGEDMAHWANTFDAQNCHAAADTVEALTAKLDAALSALAPFNVSVRVDMPDDALIDSIAFTAADFRRVAAVFAIGEPD